MLPLDPAAAPRLRPPRPRRRHQGPSGGDSPLRGRARDYRALQAGDVIMANLGEDKIMAAWGNLRGWHKEVDPAASKPCYQALDR